MKQPDTFVKIALGVIAFYALVGLLVYGFSLSRNDIQRREYATYIEARQSLNQCECEGSR